MSTIIFDFDGTLALTLEETVRIFNQLAPSFNLPQITHQNVQLVREKSIKELLVMYPLKPWQLLKLTREIQIRLRASIAQTALPDGLKKTLSQLRQQDVTLGIVTSNSQDNVTAFLNHHRLSELFSFTYAEKHIMGKGAAIKKCLKKYHLEADLVWYVGDEVRDIEAAEAAGLKIASVTWGMNTEQRLAKSQPDRIIHRPAQLLELISD